MDLSQIGVNHIYRLAPSASNVTTTFPPHVPAYVESPKALSLVFYSSLCTYLLSVPLFHLKFVKSPSVYDTQLFLSFRPPDFVSSVTHLHNALHHNSWMTANLLTITSSKTEFLFHNNSLRFTTAHSIPLIQLGTLVSSLTVISLSPTKYHLSVSLVIIMFVNFVVSAPTLTSKLPVPLPHLLFTLTLSLITAILCTTTFQNLKQNRL